MGRSQYVKGSRWARAVATYLSGRKEGLGPQPDGDVVVNASTFVECKNAKTWQLAAWLDKARDQAGPDRLAMVVVKRPRKPHPEDAYVILRLGDLVPHIDLRPDHG